VRRHPGPLVEPGESVLGMEEGAKKALRNWYFRDIVVY
jgi:hypothetical protein